MAIINKNFFQIFELPESFNIDLGALSAKYRDLQGEAHPDRFTQASEEEKLKAVQLSSYLNEAFGTLKEPLKRSAYLLRLRGIDVSQVSQQELGMDLLMEQLQLREQLAELPKDESALSELAVLKREVRQRQARRQEKFSEELLGENFDAAKKLYHEMQFLYKLHAEIESGEESRLGY